MYFVDDDPTCAGRSCSIVHFVCGFTQGIQWGRPYFTTLGFYVGIGDCGWPGGGLVVYV